nr:hypothetical protein CFP56_66328 [Quercus suber]
MAVGYVILLEVEIVGRLSVGMSLLEGISLWSSLRTDLSFLFKRGETTQPETKHRFSWQNNAQLAIMDCGYDLLSITHTAE